MKLEEDLTALEQQIAKATPHAWMPTHGDNALITMPRGIVRALIEFIRSEMSITRDEFSDVDPEDLWAEAKQKSGV